MAEMGMKGAKVNKGAKVKKASKSKSRKSKMKAAQEFLTSLLTDSQNRPLDFRARVLPRGQKLDRFPQEMVAHGDRYFQKGDQVQCDHTSRRLSRRAGEGEVTVFWYYCPKANQCVGYEEGEVLLYFDYAEDVEKDLAAQEAQEAQAPQAPQAPQEPTDV